MRIESWDCDFEKVDLGLAEATSKLPNSLYKLGSSFVSDSANGVKILSLQGSRAFWYDFETGILSATDREFLRHKLYKNGR